MHKVELHTKVCSKQVSPAFGNTLLCAAHSNELQEPYKYCRECFYKKIDELRPAGACSSQRYNGKIDYQTLAHLDRVKFMSFGVHEWLYNKALVGCEESLWKLEYNYNLFDEVQSKAKEEGLFGCT